MKSFPLLSLRKVHYSLRIALVCSIIIVGLSVPSLSAPIVHSDGTVTFSLMAPLATQVTLKSREMPIGGGVMTNDGSGIWSITVGPLTPNWYAYYFDVDGAVVGDPTNMDTLIYGEMSAIPNTILSYVFVPGPEADFMADALVPHGAVATVRYFSKLTQTERQMRVYTPPGYDQDNRPYPVLYLMHGGYYAGLGKDIFWIMGLRANYIMDNLIAQGTVDPMIIVVPNGDVTPYSIITDPITDDKFPEELMESVIPTIEQNYRVLPGPKHRALAGYSKGGCWTLDTYLLKPGAFAYYGVFSSGFFPYPLNDIIQNNEQLLLNRTLNKDTKLLWIICGPEDIAWDNNNATLALFDQYNIKYTFVQGTGGHVADTWRRNLRDFAPLLFID